MTRGPASAGVLETLPEDTQRRLQIYVALLERWQRSHNLVAPSTLPDIWTRHVADSMQLADHVPDFRSWVDLGSGGGFPGLVIAILFAEDSSRMVTLVESNAKKAAFLRLAARESGIGARVVNQRIETYARGAPGRADVVSARALAPLRVLLGYARPLLAAKGRLVLLKGRDFQQEVEEAADAWSFDLVMSPSRVDSSGCVAIIREPEPKR